MVSDKNAASQSLDALAKRAALGDHESISSLCFIRISPIDCESIMKIYTLNSMQERWNKFIMACISHGQ